MFSQSSDEFHGRGGDAKEADILAAVEKAGYSASVKGENTAKPAEHAEEEFLKDKETPVLKKRLILSFCFLVPLMYLSMGHMMWNWPLPGILAENHVAMGILQLLLTGCVMIINQKFLSVDFKVCCTARPIWIRWWHLEQVLHLATVPMHCLP